MKLHTVFITYNRLELTKRAIESYLETVTVPYVVWVADNSSTDGTVEWLREWMQEDFPESRRGVIFNQENRYPGSATNEGWALGAGPGLIAHWGDGDEPTHLQRADNDFEFLPGWCEEVERSFRHIRKLGQLGLRTPGEENNVRTNVGGNCVIDRRLWDQGIRWDERPWPQLAEEVGHGWTEDSLFSQQVRAMGWTWGRVRRPCIAPIGAEDPSDPYYVRSWTDRRIHEDLLRRHQAS